MYVVLILVFNLLIYKYATIVFPYVNAKSFCVMQKIIVVTYQNIGIY